MDEKETFGQVEYLKKKRDFLRGRDKMVAPK
jgi:hypothetical protein